MASLLAPPGDTSTLLIAQNAWSLLDFFMFYVTLNGTLFRCKCSSTLHAIYVFCDLPFLFMLSL